MRLGIVYLLEPEDSPCSGFIRYTKNPCFRQLLFDLFMNSCSRTTGIKNASSPGDANGDMDIHFILSGGNSRLSPNIKKKY